MYRIIQRRKIWYSISTLLILPGLVFVTLGGLRFGADFTGGTQVQVTFQENHRPSPESLETVVTEAGLGSASIQLTDRDGMLIRLKELSEEEHEKLIGLLKEKFPDIREDAYSVVGPTIGNELKNRAFVAILLVLLGIILYVSWAFRKSAGHLSGWAFGSNAIIALVHDLLFVVGFFAFLGYVANIEVDVLFVTALLTVLGFSVHDTIVVFDRIREGLRHASDRHLEDIINTSINTTLIRSINTSLTTILVLTALFLFGGPSIHYFVLALIVGISIGTYSSIFIASPLLLLWKRSR